MKPDYGTLTAVQRTPDDEVVREHEQPLDSYVVGWTKIMAAIYGNQDVSGVTEFDGTVSTLENATANTNPGIWSAPLNDTAFGILIGSDGTAETINDTTLGTQLTTNISHSTVTTSTGSVSGSTASITVTRTFTNNTGSSININEVGLVSRADRTAGGIATVLVLRDTGSPIDEVANGNNTTMEYTLTYEV